MSLYDIAHADLDKPIYEVYTPCGACASHLLFLAHAQGRHYHLNDGSMMWIVAVPYTSEEALRHRLATFALEYDDVIQIN